MTVASIGPASTVKPVAFAATLGIANAFILIPSQTLLQRGSPEGGLARVYATYFTISNTASFVPVLFAGAFADLFGVLQVLFVIAVVLLVIGFYNVRRAAPGVPEDGAEADPAPSAPRQ